MSLAPICVTSRASTLPGAEAPPPTGTPQPSAAATLSSASTLTSSSLWKASIMHSISPAQHLSPSRSALRTNSSMKRTTKASTPPTSPVTAHGQARLMAAGAISLLAAIRSRCGSANSAPATRRAPASAVRVLAITDSGSVFSLRTFSRIASTGPTGPSTAPNPQAAAAPMGQWKPMAF